jgi:hypothetical protein
MRQLLKGGAVLATLIVIFAGSACKSDDGDDSATLLGLTALALAPKIVGSEQARSSAGGAAASVGATTSAASATTFAFLQTIQQERMLALHRRAADQARTALAPRALPTAISCLDGACNLGQQETLTGTANCTAGGTVTANNVLHTRTGSFAAGAIDLTVATNGPWTFNACVTQALDYAKLPAVSLGAYTLSGTITMNTSGVSQGQSSGSTGTGRSTNTGRFTSDAFTVNGVTNAIDLTENTQYDFSSTVSGSSITATYNGTISIAPKRCKFKRRSTQR